MKTLDEVSRGAFGRVDRVLLSDGSIVARKTLCPSPLLGAQVDFLKLRRRFAREVRVQCALKGEFFIPVLAHDLEAPEPWFTMPLAEKNYQQQIVTDRASGKISTEPLADILNGIEHLHRLHFVHRDLKPQNILLWRGIWRLADFGLVLPLLDTTTRLSSTESAWGTTLYCAPEQILSFRHVTEAVDIYAFGCILHDLISGAPRVPYTRHTHPSPHGRIIEKCTEPLVAKRFRSVAAVRGSLMALLSQGPQHTPDQETQEWATLILRLPAWDVATFERFVVYLQQGRGSGNLWDVFTALDEQRLRALAALDASLWEEVALVYCEWVKECEFDLPYVDVVARRLECIFELSSPATKAVAATTCAWVGSQNDRSFALGCVREMCGVRLADDLAERIAIEIDVEEVKDAFWKCVRIPHHASFHPLILAALKERHT